MNRAEFYTAGRAVAHMRERHSARLPTFPAKVWAKGHAPGKEPNVVHDEMQLRGAVTQAIGVSRDEFGENAAVLEWSS